PLDRILMLTQQTCHLPIELVDLLLDQLQLLKGHLHQPAVDGVDSVQAPSASRNSAGVARKRRSPNVASAAGSVSPSASAFNIRRALAPSRSETKLDNLIWASSSSLQTHFFTRSLI